MSWNSDSKQMRSRSIWVETSNHKNHKTIKPQFKITNLDIFITINPELLSCPYRTNVLILQLFQQTISENSSALTFHVLHSIPTSKYSSQNIIINQAFPDRVAIAYFDDFNADAPFEEYQLSVVRRFGLNSYRYLIWA